MLERKRDVCRKEGSLAGRSGFVLWSYDTALALGQSSRRLEVARIFHAIIDDAIQHHHY